MTRYSSQNMLYRGVHSVHNIKVLHKEEVKIVVKI